MAGLFDGLTGSLDDPRTLGLLQLAASIGAASGPSVGRPTNLSAGILAGLGQYGDTVAQAKKMQAQAAQQEMQRQLMAAQLQDYQAQALQRQQATIAAQREAERQATSRAYLGSIGGPVGLGALKQPTTVQFSLPAFLNQGGTLKDAEEYMKIQDMNKPEYTHFEKVVQPEGERIAGITKRGDTRIFDLTPRPQQKPTQVNVNLPKEEDALYKEFSKGVGGEYVKDIQAARQGEDTLSTISQLRALAQQGRGVSGGPLAQWQTVMLGLANQAGIKLDPERLVRDQNYRAESTKLVLDNIGSLARATEKEGEMVKESLVDPTKFNAESLDLRFQIMENRARRQIAKGQAVQQTIAKQYPGRFPLSTSPAALNAGLGTKPVNPQASISPKSLDEIMQELLSPTPVPLR